MDKKIAALENALKQFAKCETCGRICRDRETCDWVFDEERFKEAK
jgi:recombinational DNA repair protein RecR